MKRGLTRFGAALTVAAVAFAVIHLGSARSETAVVAGNPTAGAALWVDNGCGACHAFAKAGSTVSAGVAPNLDRWLAPDAARLKVSVDLLTYRRIVYGGGGMTAYVATLSADDIDNLVSYVTGHDFTAPAGGVAPLPALPPPPPVVTASRRTVARWVRSAHIPRSAVPGATLFARVGCLSCHTYLGSGTRRRGAPDLSHVGQGRESAAWFRTYVAHAYTYGNVLMPSYADLGTQLRSLAAFLKASRVVDRPALLGASRRGS
jgi:mono/diheme cytochrome c family protein